MHVDASNSRTPNLVVVILNYNLLDDTQLCVESVLRSDFQIRRVVVLDNGSKTDDASKIRSRFADAVDVLRSEENLGVAAGWNFAIRHAMALYEPDFVFLLNNDAVVDFGLIAELVGFIQRTDHAGVASPPIVSYLPPHEHQRKAYQGVTNPVIDYLLCGCALLIRREVLDEIGLFDENYFVYSEETDFLERMKSSQWLPFYVPTKGRAYHKGMETALMVSGFEAYHRARSSLIFVAKHRRGIRGYASLGSYFLHWQLLGFLGDVQSGDKRNRVVSRVKGIIAGLVLFPEIRRKNRYKHPVSGTKQSQF